MQNILNYKEYVDLSKKDNNFKIKCDRLNKLDSNYDESTQLYYAKIRIYIEQEKVDSEFINYNDIDVVIYTLHPTFIDRTRKSEKKENQFEIIIWTYGVFTVKASIITKIGKRFDIEGRLEIPYSDLENKTNNYEFSWD